MALIASLRTNQRLLRDLVKRDLRARYVGSSMGFFWSVLFPIVNLFVYMFVFRVVLSMRWSDQQGTGEVALLMLAAIIVWHAFAESLSRMTNALVENQNLIQKVVFPSEVLPVYLTASALVNMLIGLVVTLLAVAFFAYGKPETTTLDPAAARVVALWPAHAGEDPATGNGVIAVAQLRCASNAATTAFEGDRIVDRGAAPWSASAAGLLPGAFERVKQRDLVYASGERWSRVLLRADGVLTVDGWRDASGDDVAAPPDGTEVVVVAPPSRKLALSGWLLSLVPMIALQGVFMLGLGYFLAAFNLFLRDTYHVIGVFLTVWMFATPMFFPAELVEDKGFGWILRVNPMHWLIDSYREVVIYGAPPHWLDLARFGVVALVVAFLGSRFFLAQKPRFPDLL